MKIKGLYQKREYWYYQPPMVKGVRPKAIALKTKDRLEALRRCEEIRRKVATTHRKGKLGLEIERYLRAKRERGQHREHTTKDTRHKLERMLRFVGERKAVDDCTVEVLQSWANELAAINSATSIRSIFGSVSGFFSWAVDEGLIWENPCSKVTLPKGGATRSEKYCTKEERDRLIETLDPGRPDLALVFWLGFFAGMRIGEITQARRDWIDTEGGVIHIRNTDTFTTKNTRHRTIRMSSRLRDFLDDYIAAWPDLPGADTSDFLLRPDKPQEKKWRYRVDLTASFKKHCLEQGVEWASFHTCRHTFATLHAMADTPLATIAREMGDEYTTTFRNYVGYTRHAGHSDATD